MLAATILELRGLIIQATIAVCLTVIACRDHTLALPVVVALTSMGGAVVQRARSQSGGPPGSSLPPPGGGVSILTGVAVPPGASGRPPGASLRIAIERATLCAGVVVMIMSFASLLDCGGARTAESRYGAELQACTAASRTLAESKACERDVDARWRVDGGHQEAKP
jgi:hypothetical protein